VGKAALRALIDHGLRLLIGERQFARVCIQAHDLLGRIFQVRIQGEGTP